MNSDMVIQMATVVALTLAAAVALIQWRSSLRLSRAETIYNLTNKIRVDKMLSEAWYFLVL